MRQLTLTEYKTTEAVPLEQEEVDAILTVAAGVDVTPSLGEEGCYDLTPDSHVGAINLETLAIEIRPKLPIERVLFLISYAMDPSHWDEKSFGFGKESSLIEAMVPGFVRRIRHAFRQGVLQGYQPTDDSLNVIRGRLRFGDQIRRRFGRFPPAEVNFDEFTDDIDVNRMIKAAIARLRRMRIRSDFARSSLRTFDGMLVDVALKEYDRRQLPQVIFNRLNQHYRPAVALAKLILRSESIELSHGKVAASVLMVDMNSVFEDFVVAALRDALRLSEKSFPQGARGRSVKLDTAQRVNLKPDISWWDGFECSFVGDLKYKKIKISGILHPDLYQLLAYTVATDLPGGLLIYAAGEDEPVTHEVVYLGKELRVVTLDLSGDPAEILEQIEHVADKIRGLRSEGRRQAKVA